MPTEDDRNANGGGEHEEHEAPPAPTFSLSDVETLVERAVGSAIERTRPQERPAAPAARVLPAAPTAEDYQNDPAEATSRTVQRALAPVMDQIEQFTTFGLSKLGDLTVDRASEKLPYYKEYKTEIDGEMGKLDPVLRTNTETLQLVHDRVAMRHEPERLKRAGDEAIRQHLPEAPAPGANRGRNFNLEPGVPSPEELGLSEEQIEDINSRGGPDAFARRISGGRMTGWKDWVASRAKMQQAPKSGGRTVVTFARLEPKKRSA